MPVPSPIPLLTPSLVPLAVPVLGCSVRVSLLVACWYVIPTGLCVPWAQTGSPSSEHRVLLVCECARAPTVCAPASSSV